MTTDFWAVKSSDLDNLSFINMLKLEAPSSKIKEKKKWHAGIKGYLTISFLFVYKKSYKMLLHSNKYRF